MAALSNISTPEPTWSYSVQDTMVKWTYKWIVNDFSFLPEKFGVNVQSSAFTDGRNNNNNKWCLYLYPRGDVNQGYTSLYLALVSTEETGEFKVKYKISVLGQDNKVIRAKDDEASFSKDDGPYGFNDFATRSDVLDKTQGYLHDDSLTVFCEMSMVIKDKHKIVGGGDAHYFKVPEYNLEKSLGSLYKSERFSDIILVAGAEKYPAHKVILSLRSSVFAHKFADLETKRDKSQVERDVDAACANIARMAADEAPVVIACDMDDSDSIEECSDQGLEIVVGSGFDCLYNDIAAPERPLVEGGVRGDDTVHQISNHATEELVMDMDFEVLLEVMRYIYTGFIPQLKEMPEELLHAAHKLRLDGLRAACEETLLKTVTVENASHFLALADDTNAPQLKKYTIDFINTFANEVKLTEGWKALIQSHLHLIGEVFCALVTQSYPPVCVARSCAPIPPSTPEVEGKPADDTDMVDTTTPACSDSPASGRGALLLLMYVPEPQVKEFWCWTQSKLSTLTHRWTITDFSKRHADQDAEFTSPLFSAGPDCKLKWCIAFKRNGSSYDLKLKLTTYSKSEVTAKYRMGFMSAKKQELSVKDVREAATFVHETELGWAPFVDASFLLDPSNDLLTNGNLTMFCDVTVVTDRLETSGQLNSTSFEVPECQLALKLRNLLTTEMFSDVTLVANEKEFRAHKAILAAHSPVFGAMFHHDMEERKQGRADIVDIKEHVLSEMVRYIYTGFAANLEDMPEDLLAAADKYALERLKMMCQSVLSDKMTPDNVSNILMLADRHSAQQLKDRAIQYITIEGVRVKTTPGWKSLIETHPHLIGEAICALAAQPYPALVLACSGTKKQDASADAGDTTVPWVRAWSFESLAAFGADYFNRSYHELMTMPSLSPGFGFTAKTSPVFVFPGVENLTRVDCFTRRLVRPIVCINLDWPSSLWPWPSCNIKHLARDLAELLLGGQREGPYCLLGVGLGGWLAVEVALQLEAQGQATHVMLVDVVSDMEDSIARQFGTGGQMEVKLLASLLKITDSKVLDALSALPDWGQRQGRALEETHVTSTGLNVDLLGWALDFIFCQLSALSLHKIQTRLTGRVTVIAQPGSDKTVFDQMSENPIKYFVQGSALESKVAAGLVNSELI